MDIVSAMEPLLPEEADHDLEDLAAELLSGASALAAGLLVSDSPKGSVRLGFPIAVVESWFPRLYPAVG